MDAFRALLACPACAGALAADWSCRSCGARFDAEDGVPAMTLPLDSRTEAVRRFYDRAPFPGYSSRDSLESLRARAERSGFARRLDQALASDATMVDVGCGTGQMCLYLARADRTIIGVDLARASLVAGAAAARRYRVDQVRFVETDLRRPGLKAGAFDVVYSSGVLHHTPDPRESFAQLARLARPGGLIVVGLYNAVARIPSRVRRAIGRLSGFNAVPFDPVLRERQTDEARRLAWLQDQYQHPEEHRHTVNEVQRWFSDNGLEHLRSFPSTVFGDDSDELFAPAIDNWRLEGWLAQLGWMWTLGHEGGLFFTIGRVPSNSFLTAPSAGRRSPSRTAR